MADSRKARRSGPGLQPERTSLAWLRTLLGYGALIALAIKQLAPHRGAVLDLYCCAGAGGVILWRYTRSRNLMDVAQDDFVQPKAVRDKFLIALAVLSLSLLFAVTHIQQILSCKPGRRSRRAA
jgi:uncharacterized membrane protein YidH (DUF202 family)